MTREDREYAWAEAAYLKAKERLRRAKVARLIGKPGPHQFGPPTVKEQAIAALQQEVEFFTFCEEQRITFTG